jgi:hypothetical protein
MIIEPHPRFGQQLTGWQLQRFIKAATGKQRRHLATDAVSDRLLLSGAGDDLPGQLFHTQPLRASLGSKLRLGRVIEIPNNNLCHAITSTPMIAAIRLERNHCHDNNPPQPKRVAFDCRIKFCENRCINIKSRCTGMAMSRKTLKS